MQNVLKKSALWSQLGLGAIAAMLLVSACGDDSGSKSSKCDAGTVYAKVGGVTDCYETCEDNVCSVGARCDTQSQICVPTTPTSNNTTSNNTTSNNTTSNNTTSNNTTSNNTTSNNTTSNNTTSNNTANNTANNTTNPDPQLVTLCNQACDLLYGSCITDNCTLTPEDTQALANIESSCVNGGTSGVTCAQEAAADPEVRSALEQLVTMTCNDVKSLRCGDFGLTQECGCATPTNLGAACTADTQCNAGDLDPYCIPETDQDGMATGFTGGYCVATTCPVPDIEPPVSYPSPACGANGVCTVIGTVGDEFAYCRAACGPNCRTNAGYACQIVDLDVTVNNDVVFLTACLPGCDADADCGTTSRCNAQGECEIQCTTTPIGGMMGNPSLSDVCAASGGTCTNGYCVL